MPNGRVPPPAFGISTLQFEQVGEVAVVPFGHDVMAGISLFDGLPRWAARAFINFVPHGYEGKGPRQVEPARLEVGS